MPLAMDEKSPLYLDQPVGWVRSLRPVPYGAAVDFMEARVADIRGGTASELVWTLEHPPLYTAGTSAKADDLIDPDRFPVYASGRGGQYTYHGPGQLVAYVMLDLSQRKRDVRRFVQALEDWIVDSLARFDITAGTRSGRIGVWVDLEDGREAKIAAIGVRLRKWVSFHGIAINVQPDLAHFDGIVPCGIDAPEFGVTSLHALGVTASLTAVETALQESFQTIFGPTITQAPPAIDV